MEELDLLLFSFSSTIHSHETFLCVMFWLGRCIDSSRSRLLMAGLGCLESVLVCYVFFVFRFEFTFAPTGIFEIHDTLQGQKQIVFRSSRLFEIMYKEPIIRSS